MECPLHALQWISEPHDFRSTGNRKKRTKERWNCIQYNLPEVTALRQIKSDRMTNTKKSSGIRAELWLMKQLSASPAKQMHKKHYYNCALYTQGPLGPKLAQTDWLWAKEEVPHNLCAGCNALEPITSVKMQNPHSWSQCLLLHWFL